MIGTEVKHTLAALVVLPHLHGGKRGGTSNGLVRELSLVLLLTVHLAVSLIGFFYEGCQLGARGNIRE